jgi:hypothetical protein
MVRKAQIQNTETIFAVFIIIIIIIVGIWFYSRYEEARIGDVARQDSELRLVSLAHSIASWPELECSVVSSRDFNCVDKSKLAVLSAFISDSRSSDSYAFNYYNDFLRRSRISVREVYSYQELESWVLYDNSFVARSIQSVFIPVNIYDPYLQKYSYGLLELTTYE